MDVIGQANGDIGVAGLGLATANDNMFAARSGDFAWQWLSLGFGQTIAAKRRRTLHRLNADQLPGPPLPPSKRKSAKPPKKKDMDLALKKPVEQQQLFDADRLRLVERKQPSPKRAAPINLNAMTNEAIRSGFDPELIGRHILRLCESTDGVDLCVAYAAIIAKARVARRNK